MSQFNNAWADARERVFHPFDGFLNTKRGHSDEAKERPAPNKIFNYTKYLAWNATDCERAYSAWINSVSCEKSLRRPALCNVRPSPTVPASIDASLQQIILVFRYIRVWLVGFDIKCERANSRSPVRLVHLSLRPS